MQGGTFYYRQLKKKIKADTGLIRYFIHPSIIDYAADKYRIRGKRMAVSKACASGSTAIGQAFKRIKFGLSDRVFAGGVDPLSSFIIAGFSSLMLVSKKNCRPFDRDRDGLNPGEGAAVLVLESRESALKRGVAPLARISGFGEALEAYHQTRADPAGKGVASAIGRALEERYESIKKVGYLHLHGTGTVFNDISEYNGMKLIWDEKIRDIPVCSTKPMTGHTFGAAGAVSSVLSIISLSENILPPTLFHKKLDPDFKGLDVITEPLEKPGLKNVITMALGFGGEVSALLFEKAEW